MPELVTAPQPVTPAPAKPATTTIVHAKCRTKTDIGPALAKAVRDNPGLFLTMPCEKCGTEKTKPIANFPIGEFTWDGGGKL